MKIALVSDLHDEIDKVDLPKINPVDLVLAAGDIDHGDAYNQLAYSFPYMPVCYVAGNHEFYDRNYEDTLDVLRAKSNDHVRFLENDQYITPDGSVRVLGCTLWTDFCLFGISSQFPAMVGAQRGLNDFWMIETNNTTSGLMSPARTMYFHEESLKWLKAMLREPFDGKTVVMTHHAPHMKSIHPRFANDLLSACFASDLENVILNHDIALWVHGHVHNEFDYMIGDTRVVCHPRGYVGEGVRDTMYEPKIIEL